MWRVPVIIGPTAGGKSDLAVRVALALQARGREAAIVTADAYQVYRGMNIGTAKPSRAEMRGVAHLLIDIADPQDAFSASDWLALARSTLNDLRARGVTPIVVGGTHLYVKLLLDGMFDGPAGDEALRATLRAMDPAALRRELERVDPAAAARIHPNDQRRTVRALEVFRLTGMPISEHQQQWDTPREAGEFALVGLEWPVDLINRRINARVKQMMERGLLDELAGLRDRLGSQAREALGYKQLLAHLEGHLGLDDAVEQIKVLTRRFAKSQRTWMRRLRVTPGSQWIDATTPPEGWVGETLSAMEGQTSG